MLYLSKSKYCGLWQCPKIAWMHKYKQEEFEFDNSAENRMNTGNDIGDLAMGLFGEYTEVTATNEDGIDLKKMIDDTKLHINNGTPVICEASFDYEGLYCAVDILKKQDGGWAIYEVKSSTSPDKDVYYADVAYQKYVLKKCGINVTGTYIITINSNYVFDGTLDINRLFTITDVQDKIKAEELKIPANLKLAEKLLSSNEQPQHDIHIGCNAPYPCGFWKYCSKHIPSPSVFDLYRMSFKNKLTHYYNGTITYEQLLKSGVIKNQTQLRQIEHHIKNSDAHVDKNGIKSFLDTLYYPLYFLDFETVQPVIPEYVGTKPYAQIPFQYSLHYIEKPGDELKHKEFLAESGQDPRRAIAESLCRDIPGDACVLAYNKEFECARINELAQTFADLKDHLVSVSNNTKDLIIPFRNGYYYTKAIGGSFSIKSVLPALFPDDPALDYHNLEGVHNGGEAMALFPAIKDLPEQEQKIARHNLLKYCELDTLAMVKIWQKLVETVDAQ